MNLILLILILCSINAIKSRKPQTVLKIEGVSNTSTIILCDKCEFQMSKVYELRITKQNEKVSTDYEMNENITMVALNNLEPSAAYNVELIALTSERKIILEEQHFTTKPNPPTDVKLLLINETNISLEWTSPQKVGETLVISLVNDSQKIVDYTEFEENSSTKNFSGLIPGSVYILVILNTINIDNKTIVVSDPVYKKFRTRPLPPKNLREDRSTLSSNSFYIKWESPSTTINSHFDGYFLSYQYKGKHMTMFIDKNNKNFLKISESIHPGVKYRIKLNTVSIDNHGNQSSVSRPIYRYITTRPLPVTKLKTKSVSKTNLLIEWTANPLSTQDSYLITYHEINTEDVHENVHVHITNNTHILLSDLLYGHNYSISVTAVSHNIKSDITHTYIVIKLTTTPSTIILCLIGLVIICIVGSIGTAFILYKGKNEKTPKNEEEEQTINLFNLETPRTQVSNNYTLIDPSLQIDENIRINRQDLELSREIGKGQFGTVYSGLVAMRCAQLFVKEPVAVKTSTCERDMNSFLKEALIMKTFNHNNVLSLIGVSLEEDGSPLVVLPFMKNGDLLKYIRNEENQPTVKQLIYFAIDVANGMDYLSKQQFIHRDLAARNCMLDQDLNVKIADFGLSRHLRANNSYISDNSKQLLPIRWMSIESIEKSVYDTKTDVWSYGVLVWEVLTRGVNPYPELSNREILKHLKSGHRLPQPQYCPNEIFEILGMCWDVIPHKRPTFADLSSKFQNIIESSQRKLQQKQVDVNEANIYYNFAQPINLD